MTVKDIAALAGVSTATVSRVLNNHPATKEKTREKVLKIIEDTNFVPNSMGRSLRKSSNKLILFMLPAMSNVFYADIFKGIEETAASYGYNVLACVTNNNRLLEERYMKLLINRQVDGAITGFSTYEAKDVNAIAASFPFVQVCEHTPKAEVSYVSVDNENAAYEATSYLVGKGHKKIHLLNYRFYIYSSIAREAGYRKALLEAGLGEDSAQVVYGHSNSMFTSGYEKTQEAFRGENKPTALFCMSDAYALGAIQYLREAGLCAGRDVDVIGFDNTPDSIVSYPMLSTVSQPQYELGVTATELLMEKIQNIHSAPRGILLPHSLILRASTSKQIPREQAENSDGFCKAALK